ncbi:MAG: hypothetical protein R3C53_08330 [Pirellulaceae bacterium]
MAKFDEKDGQPHLVFLVQQYRTEKREVQVTKFRTEQRTRRVKVVRPNGEDQEVEQTYTVNVPYAETMEANVPTPAGEKPVGVSFEKLKLFRLDATPVAPEEAAELLKTLQPVFVGVMGNGDFTAPAEIIQKALNPKTLVVLTDEVQLRRPDLRGIPVDIPLPRPLAR